MLLSGTDCGILSEAGLPCIADPGSALVALAHAHSIPVFPLGTESSILLALAASGLNGQKFNFLGYLPIHNDKLHALLKTEGNAALHDDVTRLFIETPYRNEKVLFACLACLPENLYLSVASELGTDQPTIISMSIAQWNATHPSITKQPAVFCFGKPAMLPHKSGCSDLLSQKRTFSLQEAISVP